jgi:hypothetical protein
VTSKDGDGGTPLPYGLPEDPQEPYLQITSPNLDKISPSSVDPNTFGGRRTIRGFIVFCGVMGTCLVIVGLGVLIQWAFPS